MLLATGVATAVLLAGCTITTGTSANGGGQLARLVDPNCLVVLRGEGAAATFDTSAAPRGLDVAVCARALRLPDDDETADYYRADITVVARKSVAVHVTAAVAVLSNVFVAGSGDASVGGLCPLPATSSDLVATWRVGHGRTACTLTTKVPRARCSISASPSKV